MPKHTRQNLVRTIQSAIDATAEFGHLEDLTDFEKILQETISNVLRDALRRAEQLIAAVEQREAGVAGEPRFPSAPPPPPDTLFSWARHDRIAELREQIATMQKQLAEL